MAKFDIFHIGFLILFIVLDIHYSVEEFNKWMLAVSLAFTISAIVLVVKDLIGDKPTTVINILDKDGNIKDTEEL